jgi:hypothetical protein
MGGVDFDRGIWTDHDRAHQVARMVRRLVASTPEPQRNPSIITDPCSSGCWHSLGFDLTGASAGANVWPDATYSNHDLGLLCFTDHQHVRINQGQ